METLLIKWGGSVITDKSRENTLKPELLKRLADELSRYLELHPDCRVILGHGAGSFGHPQAYRYLRGEAVQRQALGAEVKKAVRRLNHFVLEALSRRNCCVEAYHPSDYENLDAWAEALKNGVGSCIAVFHGDLVGGEIFSTEQLMLRLTGQVDRVILVTDQDGVMGEKGLLKKVSVENLDAIASLESDSFDVTGSMRRKVELMLQMKGAPQRSIVNGLVPERFYLELLEQNEIKTQIIEA